MRNLHVPGAFVFHCPGDVMKNQIIAAVATGEDPRRALQRYALPPKSTKTRIKPRQQGSQTTRDA